MTRLLATPLLALPLLAACGAEQDDRSTSGPAPTPASAATEQDGPTPRLAVTYDGGVLVLGAEDGEVVADLPLDGFTRLNPAGDERHLLVSATGGFTALDLGAWTEAHGDHGHSWTVEPRLGDLTVAAQEPGHVVVHDGTTTLFDDGTGTITSFDSDAMTDAVEQGETDALDAETWTLPEAHHGVAAILGSGLLLHTTGDEESRDGVRVTTRSGTEVAASTQCPGVHGEAFAGDVAVVGCEDGLLVVDGTTITKVASPDAYGRVGNQAGSVDSPYVLGDYKTDADAELERPTRVSVVDTRDATLRLVELPASYSFRSLGRTPEGDGLVLGTDGMLHVVDVETATLGAAIPVVAPWTEPTAWQQPRPTLHVDGDTAYVTEPATRTLHVVDLASGQVVASHDLPEVPNELAGVAG
jgi:hypothetical protein